MSSRFVRSVGHSRTLSRLAVRNLIGDPDHVRLPPISSKRAVTVGWFTSPMITATERAGLLVRDLRRALGWSQRTLAMRAGISQPWISDIERGTATDAPIGTLARLLDAMGARLVIDASAPFLGAQRQRDAVHVRCSAHVARRLERAGWRVATEVEIGDGRSRGWMDVLAWHPGTGVLLVIEIKTELRDLGAVERQIHWYEREAWAAARRLGWRPRQLVGCLLILATDAVEQRIRENRDALARSFPVRARDLTALIADGGASGFYPRRALALIDPRSRRASWLRPSRVDGRRSDAPYADYADFIRRDGRSRRPRSGTGV
jgi:transcriptional regulator with XRE-family HTH domain